MTDKEMVARIRELVTDESAEVGVITRLKMVGKLTQAQGIKGFRKCEVGHPVFEKGDRYILFMESIDGKTVVEVPYYPQTLQKAMEMTPVYEL